MINIATAKLALECQKREEKLIKVRITFKGKSKFYPAKTTLHVTKSEFLSKRTKTVKEALAVAEPCVAAAAKICGRLGQNFDWDVFDRLYREWYDDKGTIGSTDTVEALHREYVSVMTLENKTRKIYETAERWIERYRPGIRICDIGPGFITGLTEFIKKEHLRANGREISENSVRIYLRYVNALLNYAIKKGYYKAENPVTSDRRQSLGSIPRQKAALTEEEWNTLIRYVPRTKEEEFGKDFFLASVQMCGANIGDILRLRNRNIQGNKITFLRTKTKKSAQEIETPLTSGFAGFLDKYGCVDPFSPDSYIMPFLSSAEDANNIDNRIHRIVRRVDVGLKSICKSTGIRPITSYNARHTYTVFGAANGLSIEELQKFLGHASARTTQIYLSSITGKSIEKNRNFLETLKKGKF